MNFLYVSFQGNWWIFIEINVLQMVRGRDVSATRGVVAEAGGQGGMFRCTKLLNKRDVHTLAIYQSVSIINI